MADEIKTIELPSEQEELAAKKEPVTRESLKEKGWSKAEMDAAEKRGMIDKPEDEKKPDPKVKEPEKKIDEIKEPEKKIDSSLPDFTITDPQKEKVFLETFGPGTPQRAMYFRMKNERQARQRAEAERDRMALELQMRKDNDTKRTEPEQEIDTEGNVIDPEDKPLTMKQLKAMQKKEQEEMTQKQAELNERSGRVADALQSQEEYAKSILPDFDDTVKLATQLVNNLDQLSDPMKKSKALKLIKDLQVAAATADKHGVDDYTASMIAYELGQMHPEHGQKKPEPNGDKKDPKANGGLTPEQMKRIEENTQRRASSASLPGSNSSTRTVSVDDITIKDVLRMTPEQRYKFKKEHPEKMSKLMRG